MAKKKKLYFILKGGFNALKSEFNTLKETMEAYGYKRTDIVEWWKE